MQTKKIRDTCSCHTNGGMQFLHRQACCDNGWIDVSVLDTKVYIKDGTWLRYYEPDGQIWTVGHNELFDGKIEFNPDWEVIEEDMGTVYVVKPKKIIKNETNSKN